MTDLEINVELAKALGWIENPSKARTHTSDFFITNDTVYCWDAKAICNRVFSYRDPVIFVAICKRWEVSAFFRRNVCYCHPDLKDYHEDSIEKAVALCVIDAVKRGVK
jgi:hypothetical protein